MTINHGGNVFEVAQQRDWDWRDIADFSANINPLGPAPGVRPAILNALDRIVHYPERESPALRTALAAAWGIEESQILLGNGATELIAFFAFLYGNASCTLHVPVFSEFHRAFPNASFNTACHPYELPTEGLLVITNPANPTGRLFQREPLLDWLQFTKHPVLVDESFIEFSEASSLVHVVSNRPNLFVLRSLTKFYALPGLRIGALVATSDTIQQWRCNRPPWQVNVLASEAAIAALSDTLHAQRSVSFVSNEREWLRQELVQLPGVKPEPGHANFLHVRIDYPAGRLSECLLNQKILIRNCAGWPGLIGESVRIAVRTHEENVRLINAWKGFSCAC